MWIIITSMYSTSISSSSSSSWWEWPSTRSSPWEGTATSRLSSWEAADSVLSDTCESWLWFERSLSRFSWNRNASVRESKWLADKTSVDGAFYVTGASEEWSSPSGLDAKTSFRRSSITFFITFSSLGWGVARRWRPWETHSKFSRGHNLGLTFF